MPIRYTLFIKKQIAVTCLALSTVWGWVLTAVGGVISFFAAERYAFNVVLAAILIDAFFGVLVSVHKDRFILSKLGRVTSFKIVSYGASLVMAFMLEKLAHDSGFVGVKIAAAWALACEFWSMSASILILKPDAVFFRIMRIHLRGEIASKLGTNIDDILSDDKKF